MPKYEYQMEKQNKVAATRMELFPTYSPRRAKIPFEWKKACMITLDEGHMGKKSTQKRGKKKPHPHQIFEISACLAEISEFRIEPGFQQNKTKIQTKIF